MNRSALILVAGTMTGLLILVLTLSWAGRTQDLENRREACARSLLNTADSVASERDSAEFRRDAAAARRADGNTATADRYAANAARASARADRRQRRLLGADLATLQQLTPRGEPSAASLLEADSACTRANPAPGFLLP